MDVIDPKIFDRVAQFSHVGWGLAIIFGVRALTKRTSRLYLWAVVVWTTVAAFSEFYWDARYQTPAVRGSDTKDFLFMVGGAVVAVLLIWLSRIWHCFCPECGE
jgi:hypothetical protein